MSQTIPTPITKAQKRKQKMANAILRQKPMSMSSSKMDMPSYVQKISVPAAKSSLIRQQQFKSFRFQHREMVSSSVVGTTNFTTTSLIINPGLPLSFPYLSIIATAFDQYTFHKLTFEYVQRCASTQAGNVDLFPDYNSNDSAPSNEMQSSSFQDYITGPSWADFNCDLDPLAMFPEGHKRKYIRGFQTLSSNEDPKTYDAGIFYIGTSGNNGVSVGQLFANYDIEFFVPTLEEGSLSLSQHITAATAPTTAANFGASTAQSAGSTNLVSIAGNVLTFAYGGSFVINLFTHTSTSCTITALPAISASGKFITSFATNGNASSTSAAADVIQQSVVSVVSGTTVTYDNTLVNGQTADLLIVQIPPFQI